MITVAVATKNGNQAAKILRNLRMPEKCLKQHLLTKCHCRYNNFDQNVKVSFGFILLVSMEIPPFKAEKHLFNQ